MGSTLEELGLTGVVEEVEDKQRNRGVEVEVEADMETAAVAEAGDAGFLPEG